MRSICNAKGNQCRTGVPWQCCGLTAHLPRGLQRVATDALVRGSRAFPWRIEDIDAAALSRIMRRDVSSVSVSVIGDSRDSERELPEAYRRAPAASGGPDLEPQQLWRRYRQAVACAYVAADIVTEGLRRAVSAVNDLEIVAALREAS
jgi:hypothetical protein